MAGELEVISHQNSTFHIFLNEILYRTPHLHRDFEICLLLKGQLQLKMQDQTLTFNKNDLWVINPFQLHEYYAEDNAALVLIIQVSPAFFSSYFNQIKNIAFSSTSITLSNPAYKDLYISLIETAWYAFSQPKHYELKCAGFLNYIFNLLLTYVSYGVVSDFTKRSNSRKMMLTYQITTYIDENYYHKLLLADISRETNLTVNYLSHFFTNTIGTSFQKYLAKIRCANAYSLLLTTDLSLFDISISCGFSDVKYFVKNFQEFYDMHPREFRIASSIEDSPYKSATNSTPTKTSANIERKLTISSSKQIIRQYYKQLKNAVHT